MDALNKTTKEYGMRINMKKTKMMRISKNEAKQLKISSVLLYWNKYNDREMLHRWKSMSRILLFIILYTVQKQLVEISPLT